MMLCVYVESLNITLLSDPDASDTWASAKRTDGVYTWLNGAVLPDQSPMWASGEPMGRPECIRMWAGRSYQFDNILCTAAIHVLCEITP